MWMLLGPPSLQYLASILGAFLRLFAKLVNFEKISLLALLHSDYIVKAFDTRFFMSFIRLFPFAIESCDCFILR